MADDPRLTPAPMSAESALHRAWQMLLNGYGYNWYREESQLRADDILIRSHTSEFLSDAATALRDLETRFVQQNIPPLTRENPTPDPTLLAAARRIRAAREKVAALETLLRDAATPGDDRIWARYRKEATLLKQLGVNDMTLVGAARDLSSLARTATPEEGLTDEIAAPFERLASYLSDALAKRRELLSTPVQK